MLGGTTAEGGREGQVHTLWGVLTCRRARQMALLHLKPEPKAICQTLSPRFTPIFVSMLASTYLQGTEHVIKLTGCSVKQQVLSVCIGLQNRV